MNLFYYQKTYLCPKKNKQNGRKRDKRSYD
nr:MAG TPA: hypothetical protein [Bacteriophage sp.]